MVRNVGNFKVSFIDDEFNNKMINKEYKDHSKIQGPATTRVINNVQIAGNKVFKWKWVIIQK